MSLDKFLSTLFDEGQVSCFTESPNGYKVSHGPQPHDLYFCINALHPYQDLAPSKDWHSPNTPRRADANVVCYRNFLIELDKMAPSEQIDYVTSALPVTSIVHSGGKSHHFIISLTEPLQTAEEYREVASRLLVLFPEADRMCKNPSRLSRLPFRFRPETGAEQKLIHLGRRINFQDLDTLLPKVRQYQPKERTADEIRAFVSPLVIAAVTEPDQFMAEHNLPGRNLFCFWLGKRFDELGLPPDIRLRYLEMAYNNLKDVSGFNFEEAMSAARVRYN